MALALEIRRATARIRAEQARRNAEALASAEAARKEAERRAKLPPEERRVEQRKLELALQAEQVRRNEAIGAKQDADPPENKAMPGPAEDKAEDKPKPTRRKKRK